MLPDLTKLLSPEQLENLSKLSHSGGPGDPQRDVRVLLQHIDTLQALFEMEQRRAMPSITTIVVDESGAPLPMFAHVRRMHRIGTHHYQLEIVAPSPIDIQYQCRLVGDRSMQVWTDCSRDRFDYCNKSIQFKTRIVYKPRVPPEDCKP